MAEPIHRELLERRLADSLFYVLLAVAVVLAGWLAARHDRYWDWTNSGRNTLAPESTAVLAKLTAPLRITVFLDRDHPSAKSVEQVLARYRRSRAGIEVSFLDPQLFPEQAREAEVSLLGQMLLEYRGRRETLTEIGETAITAAIVRISRNEAPWVAVLEGHGERRIDGEAAPDIGRFAEILAARGFRLRSLDLTSQPAVPDNTGLLLLSTPSIAPFPGETERLIDYLDRGGNLLWLMDPYGLNGLEPLAAYLSLDLLPGLLVDANVAELNIDDPTVAMVADYAEHPLTRGLSSPALFPGTVGFPVRIAPGWTLDAPLRTRENSWNETGPISGEITREEGLGELPGPLPIALVFTRPRPDGEGEQRVLILGDGDFLSNAYLDNGGNRSLGLRMVQWLTAPKGASPPPSKALPDRELGLTRRQILIIGGGALAALPALFLTTGLLIGWHRRRG